MLPMAFAPGAGGSLRNELAQVDLHSSVPNRVWRQMLVVAQHYVDRIKADRRFSASFEPCLAALDRHLELAANQIARLR